MVVVIGQEGPPVTDGRGQHLGDRGRPQRRQIADAGEDAGDTFGTQGGVTVRQCPIERSEPAPASPGGSASTLAPKPCRSSTAGRSG